MSFMESISTCFAKYATFSGRALRSEFWWYVLFILAAQIVLGVVDSMVFESKEVMAVSGLSNVQEGMSFSFSYQPQPITSIFLLATFLPSLAVGARRLHDTGRSGWWQLIVIIPLIGLIILIVFWASQGVEGDNTYGAAPQIA